jgi:hypothetical protein
MLDIASHLRSKGGQRRLPCERGLHKRSFREKSCYGSELSESGYESHLRIGYSGGGGPCHAIHLLCAKYHPAGGASLSATEHKQLQARYSTQQERLHRSCANCDAL